MLPYFYKNKINSGKFYLGVPGIIHIAFFKSEKNQGKEEDFSFLSSSKICDIMQCIILISRKIYATCLFS